MQRQATKNRVATLFFVYLIMMADVLHYKIVFRVKDFLKVNLRYFSIPAILNNKNEKKQ